MRFTNMDLVQKEKQDSWNSFMTGKGAKKKKGFFTGEETQRNVVWHGAAWRKRLLSARTAVSLLPYCFPPSFLPSFCVCVCGLLAGTKKESIFKVPDGTAGKVGVVGSGKGVTEYQKRGKHQFQEDDQ
jgi:survival-of-motor-neuron-related-splicing factor 30